MSSAMRNTNCALSDLLIEPKANGLVLGLNQAKCKEYKIGVVRETTATLAHSVLDCCITVSYIQQPYTNLSKSGNRWTRSHETSLFPNLFILCST